MGLIQRMMTEHIAAEAIDFQTDQFGARIESIIQGISDAIQKSGGSISRKDLAKEDFAALLDTLVMERLGLCINFILDTNCPGAVMVFPVNKNSVLLDSLTREYHSDAEQDRLLNKFKDQTGTVD